MNTTKNSILIAGSGRIGYTIAHILALSSNNHITLVDISEPQDFTLKAENIKFQRCDISDQHSVNKLIQSESINAIISCLPYSLNKSIADFAKENHCHYFDVTEDVETTSYIFSTTKDADSAFIPQCGVAPGLINIMANDLIRQFENKNHQPPKSVKMFCGALPQVPNNPLGYTLNWSTDGLINEYINDSRVLQGSKIKFAKSLTDIEMLEIENITYEAFLTSGGAGTLIDTYEDKISTIFYKTLRLPGHCEKMSFLLNDLKLKDDRKTIIKILENALPKNQKDYVVTHAVVDGLTKTQIFKPAKLAEINCSAIQAITSVSTAAVVNTILSDPKDFTGPQKQESFTLKTLIKNDLTGYLS